MPLARTALCSYAVWLLATLPLGEAREIRRLPSRHSVVRTEFLRFFPLRDTVYTLSPWYLELNLQRQRLYLRKQTGEVYEFKVSSGAPWVREGMETPTGLFTLQSKAVRAISRQFDNTPMLYWMGFFGNVGFHALETDGYYRHLGQRASSHGCVRLSREDARLLYRLLPRGTPVLVYKEEPARVLAFLDFKDFDPGRDWLLGPGDPAQEQLLRTRLERLYRGQSSAQLSHRLVLDGHTVLRPGGYPVGEARLIPPSLPPLLLWDLSHFASAPPLSSRAEKPSSRAALTDTTSLLP